MNSECILIRVGEQSLKSDQVLRIFERIFIRNIKAALKEIEHDIKKQRNRFFVFTNDINKAVKQLKKVFGISSMSPCYVSEANIEDMKKVAKKIFKPKGTFAIRSRRSGSHNFTSRDIAHDVGYIINAKADLTNPDNELFIECRQNHAYLFTEKISGPGGLPLGSGGKALGILENDEDLVACWLMAKRGLEISPVSSKKKLIEKLEKWHIGLKMNIYDKIPEDHECDGIVFGENSWKNIENKSDLLVLRPLVGFNSSKIEEILTQINE